MSAMITMKGCLDLLALLVASAGLLVFVASTFAPSEWRMHTKMALTLWMAAGLLRLGGTSTWSSIGASAAILAVRQIVMLGLRTASPRARPQ